MRASNTACIVPTLAVIAIVGCGIVPIAIAQPVVIIKPNVQISDPFGPDQSGRRRVL